MKLIFALFASFFMFFQNTDLETIRTKYSAAHLNKQNAEAFSKLVKNGGSTSTIDAYKAAAKIVQAKFAVGEGRKKLITEGAKSLENIVKSDANNLEIRVIRMSLQESLPKFIKYNSNLATDKAFILKNFASQNTGLKAYIKKFAAQSKTFTAADRALLK